MLLPIADYAPDLPPNNQSGMSANVMNLFPRTKESWGPVGTLSNYSSNGLNSQCLGAIAAIDSSANNYVVAGDAADLYILSPGNTGWTLLNSQFNLPAGERWFFTQYGQRVLAAAQGQNLQTYTLGAGATQVTAESLGTGNGTTTTFSGTLAHPLLRPSTMTVTAGSVTGTDNGAGVISGTGISSGTINYTTGAWSVTFAAAPANATAITANYQYGAVFTNLAAAAPQARYITTIRDFVMVANTYDATNGNQPQRVQWCAIDDPTTWPASGSVQEAQLLAGSQIIPGDQGWIRGIVGNLGTADGAVFFERAVFRIVFQGSPTVFGFYPAEGVRGTSAPKSIAQIGALVYYLGEDGFYAFDGSVSRPIGVDRVDKTFFANVNLSYLGNVVATVDPINRLVMWLYPSNSASNGIPDSLLVYNWVLDKWGFAQINAEYIFRAITQGYSLDSLNSTGYTLETLPFSLDSRVWTGGQVLMGAFTPSHKLAYFTGSPAPATADTVELEPFGSNGKRAFVTSCRPIVDGGSPTIQIGTRQRLQDTPAFTAASAVNDNGECPLRADGRYLRARIQTSGNFTNLQGVEIPEDSVHMAGRR